MTTIKPTGPSVPGEHPTEVNKLVEPLSLTVTLGAGRGTVTPGRPW
jgi:hypothetical protein